MNKKFNYYKHRISYLTRTCYNFEMEEFFIVLRRAGLSASAGLSCFLDTTLSFSVHVNACMVLVVVVVDEQVDGHFELCDAIQQFGLEFRLNRHEVILYLCRLHQTHRLLKQIYTCSLYISHSHTSRKFWKLTKLSWFLIRTPPMTDCCTPISDVASRRHLSSASRRQLLVPRHNVSTYDRRAFSVAGPAAWNCLSRHICSQMPPCRSAPLIACDFFR